MGVHNTYLRQKLLSLANAQMDSGAAAVPSAPPANAASAEDEEAAAARKKLADGTEDAAPSAPPSTEPSAPVQPVETFQSTECVVCMENKVSCSSYIDDNDC